MAPAIVMRRWLPKVGFSQYEQRVSSVMLGSFIRLGDALCTVLRFFLGFASSNYEWPRWSSIKITQGFWLRLVGRYATL